MAVLTIPKVLREKLSDEGADALVDLINKADDKQKEDILRFLEEKFEVKLFSVEEKISSKISLVEEKFERRLSEEIGKVRTEIAESKAEIIKWMFIFIVGQFWAIAGFLFAFFRK